MTPGDADAIGRMADARDRCDAGVPDLTLPVLRGQWRVEEFDPAADARIAERDGTPIGYAALFDEGAIALVDPAHEGEGAGTALIDWLDVRVRERGDTTVRQRVSGNSARAPALLRAAGYHQVRSVLLMAIALTEPLVAPPPPDGITLRPVDVDADAAALHAVDDAAFSTNSDYTATSLAAFRGEHLDGPEFEPGWSRVAWRAQRVVGFVTCRRKDGDAGYVDILAVDAAERRRGLGSALLLAAFGVFAAAGLSEAWLDVASDNPGALRLYERAGMTVRHRFTVFEKPAR
jgi:mycothiol synthase